MEELIYLDIIQNLKREERGLDMLKVGGRFKTRVNAINLSDRKFVKIFRLTTNLTRQLIEELSEFMPAATRSSALEVELRVLIALRFYASGSYQTGVGNDIHLAVSQKSVSRAIIEVSAALNQIMDRWIYFPISPEEQAHVMRGFSAKYGVTGLLGLIDCTHVAIVPTPVNDPNYGEHNYVNRKGVHTINVQLVCDVNLKILHVNALSPGSTSDKFIWKFCNIREYFVEEYRQNRNTRKYLFGDSGYNLEPWNLIPDQTARENSPEQRYNDIHSSIRSGIERCNGLLKQRYRCLLKDRVLHYHPETATNIVNACCVLHNMCIHNNVPFEQDSDESDIDTDSDENDNDNEEPQQEHGVRVRRNPVLIAGERQRAQFIRRHLIGL